MTKFEPAVVKINSPSDVICAVTQLMGFVPTESFVVLCTKQPRRRLGLAMRFDLRATRDVDKFADEVLERVDHEPADGVFLVVFTEQQPEHGLLPLSWLVEKVGRRLDDLLIDAFVTDGERWWCYLCDDPRCCPVEGSPIDHRSPGASSLAAAYALQGQAVLPSRQAVAETIAFVGDDEAAERICEQVDAVLCRHAGIPREIRQGRVRELLSRLCAEMHDPRTTISDADAVELAALLDDVVVRDEVLVRARKTRRRQTILRILTEVARRVPFPYDAPTCGTLAYVAYANGDGVIANVALERTFATDPQYSLAHLVADSLDRQIPPATLLEVMKGAARDLSGRSAAG